MGNTENEMLEKRFLNLMRTYTDDETYIAECWKEIYASYTGKSRYYHNLGHLNNMISELNEIESSVTELDTILFSIYYHDIVYKSTETDNEYQSAKLFEKRISNTHFPKIQNCYKQIEATKEHKTSVDKDTNILLDLDLSILGKDKSEYQEYCSNIRKEYSIYPDSMYHPGRKKALNHLLELDVIFKTDYFFDKYEEKARKNMAFELSQLN